MRRPARILAALAAAQVVIFVGTARPAAAAGPRGLPTTRLELGISSDPTQVGAMKATGVPWKYRYQYLAGGANASSSWLTWNSPAGQFALSYMTNSGNAGYIPFLPYYVLLQSSPSSGGDEGTRDFNNLNNTATMNAYYSAFKVLMQRAGQYGKPVVVQVEPDFWAFMQARARALGVSAADGVPASVASSGFPDVAGFANTVAGFGKALQHLRDASAPNVTLAVHASGWSSGFDLATNVSAGVNIAAEADKTAAFLATTGAWDLVTTDVDDHDADWWAATGQTNAYFTHWWDASNVRFPNFHRWEAWIGEIHARLGLPAMVWQVPVGNMSITDSCDQGTGDGHYKDNVAQYFLSHPSELAQAGIIAALFGAGNACQTTPYNDGGALDAMARDYYAGRVVAVPAAAGAAAAATPSPTPSPTATPTDEPSDLPATAAPTPTEVRARNVAARQSNTMLMAAGLSGLVLLLLAAAAAAFLVVRRRQAWRRAVRGARPGPH
jgi:hypothetical protein